MGKITPNLLIFIYAFIAVGFFNSCRDLKDEYYARPDWLEPAIYKQLEEKGNFKSYLACVDKAGYKNILSQAGFYTVFAPDDEAFAKFLAERKFSSVDEIDPSLAKDIVSYSIVYNAFDSARLDDYQSVEMDAYIPDIAFKRQTAYSKWIYPDTFNGQEILIADFFGLIAGAGYSFPANADKNNKHIPYFTQVFLDEKNLQVSDYDFFFPGIGFSGFNVVDAKVTELNLRAENGYIHVVDKVITPLPNLEDFLASNPDEFSVFKMLLDSFAKEYETVDWLSSRYE